MADVSISNSLELNRIQQAFRKAQSESGKEPGFCLILVTQDYSNNAMDFIRDHFVTKEIVHMSAGLGWTDEEKESCLQAFSQNLSLMFLSEENEEVAAVLRTAIKSRKSSAELDTVQTQSLRESLRFINVCDEKANFFEYYGVKCEEAFHIEDLAVAEKYQKRCLATNLFKAAVSMISYLGIDPVYIKVEGSSKYSQKIFENFGFDTLCEVPFDTWEFPVQNITTREHTSQKNYGLKITKKSGK